MKNNSYIFNESKTSWREEFTEKYLAGKSFYHSLEYVQTLFHEKPGLFQHFLEDIEELRNGDMKIEAIAYIYSTSVIVVKYLLNHLD